MCTNTAERERERGFTLIELLVVIAIIGLLASVVLASLGSARAKARDARKVAEFKSLHSALQVYYAKYGVMPRYNNATCCSGNHREKFNRMAQDLINEGMLSQVPVAPEGTYSYYDYGPGNATGGILVTTLESIESTTVPPFGSCRPFTENWCSHTRSSRYFCICNPY